MRTHECSILIIGDALECGKLAHSVPQTITNLCSAGEDLQLTFAMQAFVLDSNWEMSFDDSSWDLCVLSLATHESQLFLGACKG